MRQYILLFVAAASGFSGKKVSTMAAAIAYWAILSLFPLALGGLSLLGFVFSSPEERHRLVLSALEIIPVSADFIENTLEEIAEERSALTVLAAVGSIWSAQQRKTSPLSGSASNSSSARPCGSSSTSGRSQ